MASIWRDRHTQISTVLLRRYTIIGTQRLMIRYQKIGTRQQGFRYLGRGVHKTRHDWRPTFETTFRNIAHTGNGIKMSAGRGVNSKQRKQQVEGQTFENKGFKVWDMKIKTGQRLSSFKAQSFKIGSSGITNLCTTRGVMQYTRPDTMSLEEWPKVSTNKTGKHCKVRWRKTETAWRLKDSSRFLLQMKMISLWYWNSERGLMRFSS